MRTVLCVCSRLRLQRTASHIRMFGGTARKIAPTASRPRMQHTCTIPGRRQTRWRWAALSFTFARKDAVSLTAGLSHLRLGYCMSWRRGRGGACATARVCTDATLCCASVSTSPPSPRHRRMVTLTLLSWSHCSLDESAGLLGNNGCCMLQCPGPLAGRNQPKVNVRTV